MKQDILINGVSVAELKRQKEAIQKDASKIVSEEMKKATTILNKLFQKSDDYGYELTISQSEADSMAAEAIEHLETAAAVARVANTTFYLPWDSEYDDTPWSYKIDDSNANSEVFSKLYDILGGMEGDSRGWHESRC